MLLVSLRIYVDHREVDCLLEGLHDILAQLRAIAHDTSKDVSLLSQFHVLEVVDELAVKDGVLEGLLDKVSLHPECYITTLNHVVHLKRLFTREFDSGLHRLLKAQSISFSIL